MKIYKDCEMNLYKNGLATQNHTNMLHEVEFTNNAPHYFQVRNASSNRILCDVHFQEGPVKEVGVNGVFNEDIMNMVICRLEHFQESPFACKENEKALEHFKEGMMWLKMRTLDREARGVLGTYKK